MLTVYNKKLPMNVPISDTMNFMGFLRWNQILYK